MNLREECQPWDFGFNTLPDNRLGRSTLPPVDRGFGGRFCNGSRGHETHQAWASRAS